jgi:hypothetical protein
VQQTNKEPPLCSKKKPKYGEITNTKAANNFYFFQREISHLINKYNSDAGLMNMNISVYSVLETMVIIME